MSNIHDEIKLLAMGLGDGDRTDHLMCPVCGGGSSHERSLLIWSSGDTLIYKCYRVKCGIHGLIDDSGVRVKTDKPVKRNSYACITPTPLPPHVKSYLKHRFTFTHEELALNGIKWDATKERILIPITGISHCHSPDEQEGWLARAYPALQRRKYDLPKAVAHFRIEQPTCLMKPYGRIEDSLILFEDFWSAMRVNRHLPACALSGTNLGEQAIKAMLKAGVRNLTFVLDADARHKARDLKHKHSLLFNTSTVLLSGVDPKDMNQEQLTELLGELS